MSAKPNGSKCKRRKPTAPSGRGGAEKGDRGKGLSQFSLITLWHVTGNHRVPTCVSSHLQQPSTCLSHSDTGSAATVASAGCWHVFIITGIENRARAKCH